MTETVITPEKLDELERLARAATPGPWEYEDMSQSVYGNSVGGCRLEMSMHLVADIRGWGHYRYLPNGQEIQDATGNFIAAANPAAILALIERVRTQDAEIARLREAMQKAYGYLWHANNEPGTPNYHSPKTVAYEARKALRDLLTNEQRGLAISAARAALQKEQK